MPELRLHLFGGFCAGGDRLHEVALDLHARAVFDPRSISRPRLLGTLTVPDLADGQPFEGELRIGLSRHPWSCEGRFVRRGGASTVLRARATYQPADRLFSVTRAVGELRDAGGDPLGTLELRLDLRRELMGLLFGWRQAPD